MDFRHSLRRECLPIPVPRSGSPEQVGLLRKCGAAQILRRDYAAIPVFQLIPVHLLGGVKKVEAAYAQTLRRAKGGRWESGGLGQAALPRRREDEMAIQIYSQKSNAFRLRGSQLRRTGARCLKEAER